MSDNTGILLCIVAIFVAVGVCLPFINRDLGGDSSSSVDTKGITDNVSFLDVVGSVFSMFFWSFGALPFWLDAFFEVLRIILYVIIYDKSPLGKG